MRRTWSAWPALLAALAFAAACGNGGTSTAGDDVVETVDPGPGDTGEQVASPLCEPDPVVTPTGCAVCHGMPPTEKNHPPNARCWRCHGYTIERGFTFANEKLHQNGKVDVAVGCTSCHGWNLGVSPPPDLTGDCTAGTRGVGAHLAMRMAALPVHKVGCSNCHPVPLALGSPGHNDGKRDVVFAELAIAGGVKPTWDGQKCADVYCHGATLTGGTLKTPSWTDTSRAAGACGACHALATPDGKTGVDCSPCHPTTVGKDGKLLPRGTHLNGKVETFTSSALEAGGAR
jgi:predicted CxxxxCH...CXXCH cytochrome family protein